MSDEQNKRQEPAEPQIGVKTFTPEEYGELVKKGEVEIDQRGRIRTARRQGEKGASLKRRRAWYTDIE